MDGITEKARKYRKLAAQYDVPLIVAVGAHHFTGVTLQQLDDVLSGLPAPKITFQFNAGDPLIGEETVKYGPDTALGMAQQPSRAALDRRSAPLRPHPTAEPGSSRADTHDADGGPETLSR